MPSGHAWARKRRPDTKPPGAAKKAKKVPVLKPQEMAVLARKWKEEHANLLRSEGNPGQYARNIKHLDLDVEKALGERDGVEKVSADKYELIKAERKHFLGRLYGHVETRVIELGWPK